MKEAHRQLYPSQRMEGHTKKKIIKGLWKFTQGRYHFQRERERALRCFTGAVRTMSGCPGIRQEMEVRRGSQKVVIGCLRQKRRRTS